MEGKKRKSRVDNEVNFVNRKKQSKLVLANTWSENEQTELKISTKYNQINFKTDLLIARFDETPANWSKIEDSIFVKNYDSIPSSKILGFDLDDTLIHPKSFSRFSKNKFDWMFLYDEILIKERILKFVNNGYRFVIFTNQIGIKKGRTNENDWKWKVDDIHKKLDIPMLVMASIDNDYNKKPSIGMWKILEGKFSNDIKLDNKNSIYVGDAAGRGKRNSSGKFDHNDYDLKFALNIDVNFQVPEEFFFDVKIAVPMEFDFNPKSLKKNESLDVFSEISLSETQEMIILVGSPASGKSSLVNNYMIDKGYVHINNNIIKSQIKCQDLAEEALKEGKSVVIDNTNSTKATRKFYISIAQRYKVPVNCLFFKYSKHLTFHLNNLRDINFSRKHLSKSVPDLVIHSWYKNHEQPTVTEGFKQVKEVPFVPSHFESELDKEIFYMYS